MTAASCSARRCARSSASLSMAGEAEMPRPTPSAWFCATMAARICSTVARLRRARNSATSRSLNTIAPTRSPTPRTRQAPIAAASAAATDFIARRLPKNIDSRWSTTSSACRSRSSLKTRTCGLLQPRRHLPVDRADVVAGAIVPDLLEIQPAAAHARGEAARTAGCAPAGAAGTRPCVRGVRARSDRRDRHRHPACLAVVVGHGVLTRPRRVR